MSNVISWEDRRKLACKLLPFEPRRHDCQGESYALSSLRGSALTINPIMSINEILEKRKRAKAAADARDKIAEGFCELVEADSLDAAHGWLHWLLDGHPEAAS